MWIVSLALTGVLTLYTVLRQRKYSIVQACVRGTGFFTVGCYLDIIFALIMTGIGEDRLRLFLQGMGIFISKGIMIAVLVVEMTAEQGHISGREDTGREYGRTEYSRKEYSKKENGRTKCNGTEYGRAKYNKREYSRAECNGKEYNSREEDGAAGQRWQYLDGLTMGITLFFLFLAVFVRWGVYVDLNLHGDDGLRRAWILSFFLAVLLIYDCSYEWYGKKQREKSRRFREEIGKHEDDVYLEHVEEQYQRTRELWHDLRNHITLLSLLLEEEKYVQMKDYLHIFAEDVDSLTLPMKSGNLIVDALLAEKKARARKKNIVFRLSLCNLTDIPLKPNEICGIFGNLLDNALEANELVKENRFIAVECEEKEYCYFIRIRNAVANNRENQGRKSSKRESSNRESDNTESSNRERNDGAYRSTKSDRRNRVGHGLGLRSVERVVHGCGGEFAVDRTETQFTAAVRLPKKQG